MRITFTQVTYPAQKSGVCVCGKRAVRKERFWQTLNQFNKNAGGVPKTRDEILTELKDQAQLWRNRPTLHVKCEAAAMAKSET